MSSAECRNYEEESTQRRSNHKSVWSVEEQIKLIVFISQNKELFSGKSVKRQHKVYKKMAHYINTKTPTQCRSHFQYLKNQHGSHFKIKRHIRQQYGKDNFNTLYQQYSTLIKQSKSQLESNEPKSVGIQCQLLDVPLAQSPEKTLNVQSPFLYYQYLMPQFHPDWAFKFMEMAPQLPEVKGEQCSNAQH